MPIDRAIRAALISTTVAIALAWAIPAGAQHADTIRGRVTTDSGAPLPDAGVLVTMAPSADVFRAMTDSAGRYIVTIPNGTGEYVLTIGALGWRAVHKRLTHATGDTTFVVDVSLAS